MMRSRAREADGALGTRSAPCGPPFAREGRARHVPRPSDEARLERTRCVLSLHWHGRKRKQEKAVTPQGHVNVWHVGGGALVVS